MNNDEKEINKINERLTSKLTHYLSYFNLIEKKNVQEFNFFLIFLLKSQAYILVIYKSCFGLVYPTKKDLPRNKMVDYEILCGAYTH